MAGFKLVSSAGGVTDPAVISVRASGTVRPGMLVDFSRTAGAGVSVSNDSSTTTMIFGVCQEYAQGASDKKVKVIPIIPGQLWEAVCQQEALTAHIGIRHPLTGLATDEGMIIYNTGTDLSGGNAHTAIFLALDMVGSTSGSGRLVGILRTQQAPYPVDVTTYL